MPAHNLIDGGVGAPPPTESEMVLPQRIEPVEGAVAVNFPWTAAADAIESLRSVKSMLTSQLDVREGMRSTLDDWVGTFRDDFDDKYGTLRGVASELSGRLARRAASIVGGAEDANYQQQLNNNQAELPPNLS